ncbi:MAG: hypothetical protein IBX72_13845 [Nitrospirae bacterium]|nr:hypothetical protein [Nitrospirota bacterium]
MRLLWTLAIFLIAINLISCDKSRPEKKRHPNKTVVVLCDLSESTRNLRANYIHSFKTILSSIGHGDVIVVAKITDASVVEPEIPINEAFPEFVPRDQMGNRTDNPILVQSAKEDANKKLEQKKEELIKIIQYILFAKGDHKRIMHTDIMSSLHVAERIFRNYKRDKFILVMLSDMIEDSSEYNFEKENLNDRRIEEIIKSEKAKNKIPALKDVKVYVVAAGAGGSTRFFAIQNFWLRYFKECGANLSKENYGSALLSFDE